MCGIVGYVGQREVVPLLMDGLRRLEYRGYDSAGVVAVDDGELQTVKAEGKLDRLKEKLEKQPLTGRYGLGHTRWATHGAAERAQRPPDGRLARPAGADPQRHHRELPAAQEAADRRGLDLHLRHRHRGGREPHLLLSRRRRRCAPRWRGAVKRAGGDVRLRRGDASRRDGQEIVAARQGPPLVIGLGEGEQFLASDPSALLAYTKDVIFLENGDLAPHRPPQGVEVRDRAGKPVERARPAPQLGPDPGREGRLQALHAQGDPRAAAGRAGHLRRPRGLRGGRGPLRHRQDHPRGGRARSSASTCWPAAPPGTRRWSASS